MPNSQPEVSSLDHLVLTVTDIAATCAFYQDILGMTVEEFVPSDGSRRVALKFGDQKINLHKAGNEFDPKSEIPTPGSADLCFLTTSSLDTWIPHLNTAKVTVEEGPVARTGATGPIQSIYIRDPDKNLIEISVQSGPATLP